MTNIMHIISIRFANTRTLNNNPHDRVFIKVIGPLNRINVLQSTRLDTDYRRPANKLD